MAAINLPVVTAGKDDKETMNNLFAAYSRLRKELNYALQNLSSENITSINANETVIKNITTTVTSIWGAL